MGKKKGKRGLMKKIIITIFTIFALFSCAEDNSQITKITQPVRVEIISSFTEKNVSNFFVENNDSLMNCNSYWGVTNNYNEAMTLYAKNLMNNNMNNNVSNGYIQICNGRVNNPSTFYNFLKIKISDLNNVQEYTVKFGSPDSYSYIVGYENQLINQAIEFFKNDPTASFVGNFYVELE